MRKARFIVVTFATLLTITGCGGEDGPTGADGADIQLQVLVGNDQFAFPSTELPVPLTVQTVDDNGVAVQRPGVTVSWTVRSGGGEALPTSSSTDERGQVATRWVLGPDEGEQTVDASGPAGRAVTFSARAVLPGPIAFVSNTNCNLNGGKLFVVNPDGTDRLPVTSGCDVPPLSEHKVDWSPDGTQIAFVRRDEDRNLQISVIGATGTAERQLTFDASGSRHPDWSPDGTRIAFTVDESSSTCADPNSNIFVMDADGGDRQRRTEGCGEGNRKPDWSPDGTRILFTSERSGAPGLYVMQADGTGEIRLADGPASEGRWSPDGERIVFVRGFEEVWIMDADGSNQMPVYDQSPWFVSGPEWSPDGSQVIFTDAARFEGTAEEAILIIDVATRTVTNLTSSLQANINCCASWRR